MHRAERERQRHRRASASLHQSRDAPAGRPAGHYARRRHLRGRRPGPPLPRGDVGPVVRLAGLQQCPPGQGRQRRAARRCRTTTRSTAARTRPPSRWPRNCSRWRRCRCPRCSSRTPARRPTTTAVKLVWYYHNAIGKPAKKKIIVAQECLSRRDRGGREPQRPGATTTATSTCRSTASCTSTARTTTAMPKPARARRRSRRAWPTRSKSASWRKARKRSAAFIAEPVMGAGGVLVPPATYFEKIQRVLRKYEVLLIADEVICGFGRTGEMFGSTTFGCSRTSSPAPRRCPRGTCRSRP
jgi:hypothetical protein